MREDTDSLHSYGRSRPRHPHCLLEPLVNPLLSGRLHERGIVRQLIVSHALLLMCSGLGICSDTLLTLMTMANALAAIGVVGITNAVQLDRLHSDAGVAGCHCSCSIRCAPRRRRSR